MSIIKTCVIHGALNISKVKKCGAGYRCLECFESNKKKLYTKLMTQTELDKKLILKKCKTHGDLNVSNIYIDGTTIRCKHCKLSTSAKSHAKYKEKYATKYKEHRQALVNVALKEKRKQNIEEFRQYGRDKYHRNRETILIQQTARRFGITSEEYMQMIEDQENKCAICFEYETRKSCASNEVTKLSIDHDHKTGKVRGLLCANCNSALGKMKESAQRFQSAINYLNKYNSEAT